MKLLLTFLVIPLIIVIAARSPQATGHVVGFLITVGAEMLNGVAVFLNTLFGGH